MEEQKPMEIMQFGFERGQFVLFWDEKNNNIAVVEKGNILRSGIDFTVLKSKEDVGNFIIDHAKFVLFADGFKFCICNKHINTEDAKLNIRILLGIDG